MVFFLCSVFQYNIKKKEEVVEMAPQEEPNPLMRKKKTPEELAREAEEAELDDFTSKLANRKLRFSSFHRLFLFFFPGERSNTKKGLKDTISPYKNLSPPYSSLQLSPTTLPSIRCKYQKQLQFHAPKINDIFILSTKISKVHHFPFFSVTVLLIEQINYIQERFALSK